MFTNPNLIYFDRFVFYSIPRLFVCLSLRLRISSSQQYANVYVKSIFICPGSIAGVPFDSARRFRPTLLLHTTCVRSCCTWRASCVAAFTKKRKNCNALEIIFDLPFGFPINNIISLQRLTINKHSQIKRNQKNNNYTSGGRRLRLVVPLPIEKRSFWCPARQCPRQNMTRSNISGGSDRPWSSNRVNGDRPGGKPKTPSGPQLHAMGLSTLSWPACTLTGMCTTMSCRCSQTLYSKTTPAGEWPPGLEASVRDECFHWCTLWWPPHLQYRCTEIHDPSVPPTCCAQVLTGRLWANLTGHSACRSWG